MKSIKLYIKSASNIELIEKKVENYSYAFRKLYCNIHRINDIDFRKYICEEFGLTEIEYRSVCSEVKSRFSKTEKWKDKTETEIVSLTEEIKELQELKEKKKLEKGEGKDDENSINKINRKIYYF